LAGLLSRFLLGHGLFLILLSVAAATEPERAHCPYRRMRRPNALCCRAAVGVLLRGLRLLGRLRAQRRRCRCSRSTSR
jgi:hypothetical protein